VLTAIQLLAGVLAVAAAVAAVAVPNARHATLGAFAAILLAALVADPLPSAAALVARLAGTLLGGWLVWTALRGSPASGAPTSAGSDAAAAALEGGSLVARGAMGTAAALGVLAAIPVVMPRDGHRLGLGVVLLVAAAALLCAALGQGPDDSLELGVAILTALTGAALAAVTAAHLHAGGDLLLRDALAREPAVRHHPADEAHRGRSA
jgi:hypothetical protein